MSLKDVFDAEKAFGEEIDSPNLFDSRNILFFGKVDTKNNPIIPKIESLKQDSNHINISFVVEEFNLLIEEFKLNKSVIPSTSLYHYNNIGVFNSYILPNEPYKNRITLILDSFLRWVKPEKWKVKSFKDFYSKLVIFLIYKENRNLTLENFLKFDLGIFSNGLTIKILSNDSPKEDFFKDPAFKYFNNICLRHNFMIDKYYPSRIVYNLRAPQITEDVYIDILTYELNMLKDIIWNFYVAFLEEYPYEIYKNKHNEYIREYRDKIVKMPLKNTQLVDLYFQLKAREEKKDLDKNLVDKLKIEMYKMMGSGGNGQSLTTLQHLINDLTFDTYYPIFPNNQFFSYTQDL